MEKKSSLQQRQFPHRQQLVGFQKPSRSIRKRQSTLTQLNFVCTPSPPDYDTDVSSGDDVSDSARPAKRRRIGRETTSTRSRDSTLTQIGFVNALAHDDASETEFIANSQYEPLELDDSPTRPQDSRNEIQIVSSSPIAARVRQPSVSWYTPKTTHRVEAPSSQTPASAALSPTRKQISEVRGNRSLLAEISTNIPSDPPGFELHHCTTIQDSDDEQDDLLLQRYSDFKATLNNDSLDRHVESTYDTAESVLPKNTFATQEQFTYDPAASALDRDAARAAWTQYQPVKLTIEDTYSDEPEPITLIAPGAEEDPICITATPPRMKHLRPSQVSTVVPTQFSSPPPLVFTSASSDRQARAAENISSTPILPLPPWDDTQLSRLNSTGKETRKEAEPVTNTLSDFSLPPPPGIDWGSSQYSIRRFSSKE